VEPLAVNGQYPLQVRHFIAYALINRFGNATAQRFFSIVDPKRADQPVNILFSGQLMFIAEFIMDDAVDYLAGTDTDGKAQYVQCRE